MLKSESMVATLPAERGRVEAPAHLPSTVGEYAHPALDQTAPKLLESPAVVILGGEANALSVARDLGRQGVKVYGFGESDAAVRHSRYCQWIPLDAGEEGGEGFEEVWARFLLSDDAEYLHGSVLLACSDAGIQVLSRHREKLLKLYRLDESDTSAQISVLDKLTTYKHAREAGIPTPRFWETPTRQQVLALRESLVFPVLIKPRLSHIFEAHFNRKHVIVSNLEQLLETFDKAAAAGIDILLMEWIPGGDDRLCSYYTYLDEDGTPLFHFTKRVIRRFPVGMGTACYHITDWIPELPPLALKLFHEVGLRGLANIEFKQDPRDGQYKVIEVNARFTASNCLVSGSGFSLATFIYNRITGRPQIELKDYKRGLRLWDPVRDFWCYRELSRAGEITLWQWIKSILHRQTFPFFAWTDPMPAVARACKPLARRLRRAPKKS
ncbi:MAG TPA: hypothetical protein VIL86_04035 [Tepidisphaeraceae bacterium]